ncbi:hypothetical protein [Gymnodinialimonas hymeniacidonis]|uniref:hypothetical protein n=1 Tax=Gymnodinialimonas hymeniacidonis TaxID=3126508 RepID=UPI0034C68641
MTDHKKKTLEAGDIKSTRMDRRAMLRTAGIAGLAAGAAGVSGCVAVPVGPGFGTGITDADNGPIIDPGGFGRGGLRYSYTGFTDRDNGPIYDPGGQGRGPGY